MSEFMSNRLALAVVAVFVVVALIGSGCTKASVAPTATPAPTATRAVGPTPTPVATPTKVVTPTPTPGPKVLSLGVMGPLTGAGAGWGIPWCNGAEMAAEEINAAGGIKVAGETYTIKFFREDDKYTSEGGATAAHKLVFDKGCKFIIGTGGSAPCLGTLTVTEPNKVLVIGDSSTYRRFDPGVEYFFTSFNPSKQRVLPLFKWVKEKYPNAKRYALTFANDETGWSDVECNVPRALKAGWEVVATQGFERGTTDYYPILSKVLAQKPDIIDLGASASGELALQLKQLYELGYKGLIITPVGSDPSVMVKVTGGPEPMEGFIQAMQQGFGEGQDPQGINLPSEVEFYNKYMKRWGAPWLTFAMFWYDMVYILKMAIEGSNSLDTTTVKNYIETAMSDPNKPFQTVCGPTYFAGKDVWGRNCQGVQSFVMSVVRGGKCVNVARVMPELHDKG